MKCNPILCNGTKSGQCVKKSGDVKVAIGANNIIAFYEFYSSTTEATTTQPWNNHNFCSVALWFWELFEILEQNFMIVT